MLCMQSKQLPLDFSLLLYFIPLMSKEEVGKQTLALVCVYALLTCMLALDHITLYSIIYGNNSIQRV